MALWGDPSLVEQTDVSPFIRIQLNERCPCRGNGVALRRERKAKVGLVDPHQRLTGFDPLTDIHEPFHDFTGNAKTEIALYPRRNEACKGPLGCGRWLDDGSLYELRLQPRVIIFRRDRPAAGSSMQRIRQLQR